MRKNFGTIEAWQAEDLPEIELQQGVGVARPVPRHWHEEYQLCLISAGSGELHYRGSTMATPPASLFIVHPGEVHSNRSLDDSGCSFRTIFLQDEGMRRIVDDVLEKRTGSPFFREAVVYEPEVIQRFFRLHAALAHPASKLERQVLLLELLSNLICRFLDQRPRRRALGNEGRPLQTARDYLDAHSEEKISLDSLAAIAGLSPFHFNRVFSAHFGVPPHVFQTQLRVLRVKKLLRSGTQISEAALQAGFADQSHLNRHFKRLTGVTPGQFIGNSKIVQDSREPSA